MPKLKLDENLRPQIQNVLVSHRLNAATVAGQGLRGRPDGHIIHVCQSEQRALITLDRDFENRHVYPPLLYHGIIVLRPQTQSTADILDLVVNVLVPELRRQDVARHLWIVEPTRVTVS